MSPQSLIRGNIGRMVIIAVVTALIVAGCILFLLGWATGSDDERSLWSMRFERLRHERDMCVCQDWEVSGVLEEEERHS